MITKLNRRKVCVLCCQYFKGYHALCEACIDLFPIIKTPCSGCALPLPNHQASICGQCINDSSIIQELMIKYPFIEPLRTLIHQFKYHQGLYLSSTLSYLIWKHISLHDKPDILLPVPMHAKKLQQRGFNQALLLTKHLSHWLRIPYDTNCCEKKEHTPSQTSLSASTRSNKAQLQFEVQANHYKHVALIDDVYTTGSTVRTIAAELNAKGVKRIDVWCIARAL